MKTYRFEATYYYSDAGEIEVDSIEDVEDAIENLAYVVSNSGGYSLPWDSVSIDQIELVSEDEEYEDE